MEHAIGDPQSLTLREATTPRRTVFDMIENPHPGWQTRKIKHVFSTDRPAFWRIELMRDQGGAAVQFEHESLFVAWVRATEQAHMHEIELFAQPGLEVAAPLGVDGTGE